MPVYNCAKYLREAVESILNQTFHEFEFIIVNDGSIDESLEILKEYANKDSRIKIVNQPNSGIVVALNRGVTEASGEWIFRLDADDVAMPERLSKQLNFVQDNDGVVLVGSGCIEVDKNGIAIKKHIYPQGHNDLIRHLENGKAFFPHSSAFFNKECIMKLGGYNRKFTGAEDLDMWLRIGETAPIACLQIPAVKLRKHPQMISNINQGRLQQVVGLCARICHFRRKAGLSDPSQMGQEPWQKFLEWVEKRMYDQGYFQQMQGWQALRNNWYYNAEVNKLKRLGWLLKELIQNPSARKAFWGRFGKEKLAMKLAQESRKIF
jgi:glycosyltransferase involved in cell wall biosynthesis